MPAPTLLDNLMAVLGLPLAFVVTSLGVGLLIERGLRARLPNALLVPLGACGSIVVTLLVYWTGSGDVPAVVLLLVLTVAGGIFARGGLLSRVNPGWPGLAGLAAYLLFIAPVLFSGHWTWSGYNFVNDTATQFLLTAYMKTHGTIAVGLYPPKSTATEFLRAYLGSSYPLGTQAHLATLSGLLRTNVAVVYQGYLSCLAGAAAMSLATLPGRLIGPRMSAVAGFAATGAALTYQYALQGNIKELGTFATSMAALAVIRQVIVEGVDVRGGLLAAVPLAAVLDCYYSAGLPFAGAVAGVSVLCLLLLWWRDLRWRLIPALGAALVAVFALAAPASASFANSFNSLSSNFIAGGAPMLGQLVRPLPFSQVSGIWLTGDYRYPVVGQPAAVVTLIVTVLIFVLAAVGAVLALRLREVGPVALLVAMGLVLAVVFPTVTPYAGGITPSEAEGLKITAGELPFQMPPLPPCRARGSLPLSAPYVRHCWLHRQSRRDSHPPRWAAPAGISRL